MWSLVLCLVTTMALDPTATRKLLNPYVLYDFLDADQNGNTITVATDKSANVGVNFGSLNLNMNRASWLRGRPGVVLQQELTASVTSAMSSTNNFSTSWMSYLNNTFVIELWIQADFSSCPRANVFALSRAVTNAALNGPLASCNATEPMMDFMVQTCSCHFRTAMDSGPTSCNYNLFSFTPEMTSYAVPYFLRYYPYTPSVTASFYNGSALGYRKSWNGGCTADLKWTDIASKLYFSTSNNLATLNYNVLSFAIYPDLTTAQMDSLAAKGLPNAKPYAPTFQRAVQETVGGTIKFCPNVIGTPRDSDCLDYTNNATASGQTHTLTPSVNLQVIIMSLPTKGTLSQGGVSITTTPFTLNPNNTVTYIPAPDTTSWYAQWKSTPVYNIFKNDYTLFTYMVQDPDGAQSSIANVTIEVYPRHTPPISSDVAASKSTIYAGRNIIQTNSANSVQLQPVITEFLPPDSVNSVCADSMVGTDYVMCLSHTDHPDPATTFVTIKSLPSVGSLYYVDRTSQAFLPVAIGTNITSDQLNCGQSTTAVVTGICNWNVWYNVPSSLFTSSNATLAQVNFTYTTTTTFDLQQWMGNTRYIVDSVGSIQSVNFIPQVVSNVATVYVDVKNGFYAANGQSSVNQHNLSTIAPQEIDLAAADVTVSNPVIVYVINSLPAKGGLFVPGKPLVPSNVLKSSDLPANLPNNTVLYQPSLPTEPYGFESGQNYASFNFYAISGGKNSNIALQVINVVDTNDAVSIFWSPTASVLAYKRVGNPQKWNDLAGNELYVNFTDPDTAQPNEPYYQVDINSDNQDFYVFLSDSIFTEIQAMKGFKVAGSVAGAGSYSWQFVVPRDLAQRALMSIRLRPNGNVKSSRLIISVTDCILMPGLTDPKFSNWQSIPISVSITLSGTTAEAADYVGVADPVVTGVIYGVYALIGIIFLVCGFFIVRWCCRKRGGGSSGSSGSTKTGSTYAKGKGKGKKAKSAYLHEVEL